MEFRIEFYNIIIAALIELIERNDEVELAKSRDDLVYMAQDMVKAVIENYIDELKETIKVDGEISKVLIVRTAATEEELIEVGNQTH